MEVVKAVVTGASSGTGAAISELLKAAGHDVFGVSREGPDHVADFERPGEVAYAASTATGWLGGEPLDLLIHCAGVNHLAPLEDLVLADVNRLVQVNCIAGVHLTKLMLPRLKSADGVVCSIVSNAADIPMTHSLAYNVSKAAQAMSVRQMAHELSQTTGITVFGVSPAKISGTQMSEYIDKTVPEMRGWTKEFAREYQLKALKSGRELAPREVADFTYWLLAERGRSLHLNGLLVPYGA